MPLLAWSLTFAALVHIFEEFVYPRGVQDVVARLSPGDRCECDKSVPHYHQRRSCRFQRECCFGDANPQRQRSRCLARLGGSPRLQRGFSPSGRAPNEALFTGYDFRHPALHSARLLRLPLLFAQRTRITARGCRCCGARRLLLLHFHCHSPPQGTLDKKGLTMRCSQPLAALFPGFGRDFIAAPKGNLSIAPTYTPGTEIVPCLPAYRGLNDNRVKHANWRPLQ